MPLVAEAFPHAVVTDGSPSQHGLKYYRLPEAGDNRALRGACGEGWVGTDEMPVWQWRLAQKAVWTAIKSAAPAGPHENQSDGHRCRSAVQGTPRRGATEAGARHPNTSSTGLQRARTRGELAVL